MKTPHDEDGRAGVVPATAGAAVSAAGVWPAGVLDNMLEGFAWCRMLYDEAGRRDDFEYLVVNPAFGRLTGLENVVGRRVTEVLPTMKQENPELLDIYGAVAETGEPAEFDIDFAPLCKWLHVSATRPREGEFVTFFYDITPRVQAEAEAREASRRLDLSLAAAGAGTWEWDVASGANSWSRELWGLYDLDEDTRPASFESWLESVRPEDRERLSAAVLSAAAEGLELDFEWQVATRDGSVRWLLSRGRPELGADGRPVLYRGVVVDVTRRKLAEQALRAEEAHKQVALDTARLGVWRRDVRTGVVTLDERSRRHYGFDSGTVTFGDALERVHPDDLEALRGTLAAALDPEISRGDYIVEYRVVPPDEPVRWLSVGVHVVFEGEGPDRRAVTALGVSQDITERRQAELALVESELKFRSLFEHSSIGVFITEPNGRIRAANPAAQAMFGYTEDEFSALGRAGVLDAGDPRLQAAVEERDLTGRVQAVELVAVRKDGERFPVEVDSTIIPGPPPRAFVLMRDISWRKEAELALASREAEAREMLERLSRAQALGHMGDWAWDVATGVVAWSPEVHRVFGLGFDAPTTFDDFVALLHDDDRAWHLRRVERVAADPAQASATFGFRIVRPDGEVREINQTALVERDAAGAAVRMYGLVQDVTELRRAEQALVQSEARLRRLNMELEDRVEQRTQELRRANEELESFSYSVSHDLRAPLRHIAGYSQLLAERLGDDLGADARHFMDVIVGSAREMGQLIDDLLQLSRLGRADLHIGVVDMGACVQETLELVSAEYHGRATVRVGELPEVRGDRTLLRQVWVNLLENAFKYSQLRESPVIEVGAVVEDGETVYFVRDNGVGFDMAYADKLFAVFQRLHSTGEFEGTGIGLATVRRLVDRLGGRVWAQGAVDEGATFFFTVPGEKGGVA